MTIKPRPFLVPNFVFEDHDGTLRGAIQARSFPLRDLDPDELAELCRQFRAGVFAKAGKVDPELSDKKRELLG